MAIQREIDDYVGEAVTLNNIAEVHDSLGHYAQALENYQRALRIRQEIGSRAGEGLTLSAIGLLYHHLGEYQQALENYEQALDILQTIGDRSGTSTVLNNIGAVHDHLGRYTGALESYQQALDIVQEMQDRVGEVLTLNNIGEAYYHLGRYQQALKTYQLALAITQEINNRREEGRTFSNLGTAYDGLGRYEQALKSYQQALLIRQEIGDRTAEGVTLSNIGEVYYHLGRFEQALESYEQVLNILQETNDQTGIGGTVKGVVLNGIATVYFRLGRYEQALENYQQALDILQNIGYRTGEGTTLSNIAAIYGQLGRYEQALESFEQALHIAQEIGDRSGEATTLNGIAVVYFRQKHFQQALEVFRQALDVAQEISSQEVENGILHNLGSLFENQGSIRQAILYYQRAISVTESIRDTINVEELKVSFIDDRRIDTYARLINLLWMEQQPEQAFDYSERARARSFLDQMGLQQATSHQNTNSDLTNQEQELRHQIISMQNALSVEYTKPVEQQSQELLDTMRSELEQVRKQYEQLIIHLKVVNPEYASLVSVKTLSLEEIQQQVLDPQTTLIEYFITDKYVLAWVINKQEFNVVSLEVTRDNLTNQVKFLRNLIDNQIFDSRLTSDLYSILINPLKPYIHHTNLIIVPHDVLHYLPFASLQDTKTERYLIEDYTLTYAPSASVLKFILEKRSPNDNRLVVMANPDGSLLSAEEEAHNVAELYGVEPVLGARATESQVYAHAGQTDVLHLAAHGVYDLFNPLFTRIELATDAVNDGNLEVHEVFDLDLTGVNLVVLSACETSLGKQSAGDELVGLTRAFLYAGAPSVVTSLWEINDEASAILMTAFHRYLCTGMTTADALRSAQLEVLRQERWRSPYYWAAFSLHGDYLGHEE